MKDSERYGRLSSLLPTFVNEVKDMLDTVRQFTVTAMSEDLEMSTFTAHKIAIIKKICL